MEITSLGNKKSPRSLHLGNKDRMNILRYHLVCRRSDHLMQMPTHLLPSNAGNASEDTKDEPVPPALDGPFANPLFAPLSALRNSLWMRCRLYFRLNGFIFKLCLLYTFRVRLSSTFFHGLRTNFANGGGVNGMQFVPWAGDGFPVPLLLILYPPDPPALHELRQ